MSDPSPRAADVRYVMVPVPREYVVDVLRWVLFRIPADDEGGTGRNAARVAQLLDECEDLWRSILVMVARAALQDDALRLRDVVDDLSQDAEVILGAIREMNKVALGGTTEIVKVRAETAVGVLGKQGRISVLTMRPDIARMVQTYSRGTHAGED